MEENSRFLVQTILKKIFMPTLLSGMLSSVQPLVICFLTAYFLDNRSLVAISLFFPVYFLWDTCCDTIGIGGSTVFSRRLGAGDGDGANDIFHKSLWAILAAGITVGILPFISLPVYVTLLGATSDLTDIAINLAYWVCLATPFNMAYFMLGFFIRNDSHPRLVTTGFIVGNIVEYGVDIVLLTTSGLGVISVVIGKIAGNIMAILVLLTHFRWPERNLTLGLKRPTHHDMLLFYKNSMSDFCEQLTSPVVTIVFNNLVLRYFGVDIMAVWAILSSCQSFNWGFEFGLNASFTPIISTFYGEKNGRAIYETLKSGVKHLLVVSGIMVVVYMVFTYPIVGLFAGGLGAMTDMCVLAVRCYVLCLPFAFFNRFALSTLQTTEHPSAAAFLSLLRQLFLPLFFGLLTIVYASPEAFWLTKLVAEAGCLLVLFPVFTLLVRLKGCPWSVRSYFGFAELYKAEITMLLTGDFDELEDYRTMAGIFLKHYDHEEKDMKVSLLMEEILSYLLEMGFRTGKGDYVDYNLYIRRDDSVFMRVRSNSRYLSIGQMRKMIAAAGIGEKLELKLMVGLTDKLVTTNVNGMNTITLEV